MKEICKQRRINNTIINTRINKRINNTRINTRIINTKITQELKCKHTNIRGCEGYVKNN